MKQLAAALAIVIPALAHAEAIDPGQVREFVDNCIAQCQYERSIDVCAAMCDCMGDSVAAAWTAEDFNRYADDLRRADGAAVLDSLAEITRACAAESDMDSR